VTEELKVLLASHADPNSPDRDGFTPLHFAAQEYQIEAARLLLDAGADVNSINKYGNSPLFVAVFNSNGRGELISLLRSHGADPFLVNRSGQTPLGLARLIANYDVAQYFEDLPG
jgi:ankyrin repeat protein